MLHSQFLRSKWTAVSWLILITILFFLPGSALPKETWLSKVHIDKWVHTGFFAVLLFLWRSAWNISIKAYGLILFTVAIIYGLLVEIVQKNWVANRDFDLYDLCFDTAGTVIGLLTWHWVYKKNKPL